MHIETKERKLSDGSPVYSVIVKTWEGEVEFPVADALAADKLEIALRVYALDMNLLSPIVNR